jgi:hypothetical protein
MLGTWVSGVVLVGGTLMFGCCRAWGCLVQPSCEGGGNGSVGVVVVGARCWVLRERAGRVCCRRVPGGQPGGVFL